MKVHDVAQGSQEWTRLRMGKPTASEFHKIVTPTGKLSTQAEGYMLSLIAELLIGRPLEGPTGMAWMDRGRDLEAEAASYYEFQRDIETTVVGFITNDEETIGASPDRLVGDEGLLELKCPKPETHVEYLLLGSAPKTYYPQLQGQLFVTGRKWVDICSYHPLMPAAIVRVERDEKYIEMLSGALSAFVTELWKLRGQLESRGLLGNVEVDEYADLLV